ncbi:bifunctional hydroxymethylpyrimidine kinase/phosphomethylpyrimidine kinase [Paenibacillus sacheonensis]|uniref:Hydroxymethylpyrimidine/phosphomethylpyrimidine kinase n=1 Tax=Paenibacillus sacheonensis TaxID=742054 RepID=A0A7X4YU19_9BACL|nr:bifunctional hydroxymethylpyrimidine kinase/phosphomethylpyrimidine kinase [Paenibacillus sacheonensis]MBM7568596.1 hydroxymethylpyrimidine/phosphomethylpyrimidine kinase [Paenibacillus sacheonensis]NBC72508.1 bifunctional hydroxymethylpyrimidine kinase/phosphomethylpyrimidine kinase [Paenibacillus sacheonensis]
MTNQPKVARALTIAGSDSGGGAGIQADLKTFQELRVFGMSAITAVTAQNTLGVQGIYPLTVEAVGRQIDAIGEDLGADAVKTGMLFSSEIIVCVAEKLRRYRWQKVVVDPVMIAKGGAVLLLEESIRALKESLLPLAWVVTPNIPEAELLTGMKILGMEDRKEAARKLAAYGAKHVVMKGGHDPSGASVVVDLLFDGRDFYEFSSERRETRHTHGTGCTFAAAITAELARGRDIREALAAAKSFIQAAIEDSLELGHGHGPTNHWAYRDRAAKQ